LILPCRQALKAASFPSSISEYAALLKSIFQFQRVSWAVAFCAVTPEVYLRARPSKTRVTQPSRKSNSTLDFPAPLMFCFSMAVCSFVILGEGGYHAAFSFFHTL
jgi:hypothetical protein